MAVMLVAARRLIKVPYAATAVAAAYVAYRCVMWLILGGMGFPLSAVPFFLILVGAAVDAVYLGKVPARVVPVIGALLVTAAGYGGMWLQSELLAIPPIGYWSFPFTLVVIAAAWTAVALLIRRMSAVHHTLAALPPRTGTEPA
jgi:hypothetical protein